MSAVFALLAASWCRCPPEDEEPQRLRWAYPRCLACHAGMPLLLPAAHAPSTLPRVGPCAVPYVPTQVKYEGFIRRQSKQLASVAAKAAKRLPADLDYSAMTVRTGARPPDDGAALQAADCQRPRCPGPSGDADTSPAWGSFAWSPRNPIT